MAKPRSHNSPADSPEAGLKTVLDAAPVGMLAVDDRETLVYANLRAEQAFGRKLTAPGAIRCGDFIYCSRRHTAPEGCGFAPDCPSCPLFQAIRSTLAGDPSPEVVAGDLRLEREAPLDPVWINYKASPATLGSRRHAILSVEDISERKRDEQHLQNALAELAVIHANAPLVMMLMDSDRRVRKIEGLTARMAGREPGELVGLSGGEALRCLHHLDDPRGCGFGEACSDCAIRRVVNETFASGQKKRDIEARLPIRVGDAVEERCLLVATAHLTIGGSDRVLVSALDITERKRSEEALRNERDFIGHIMDTSPAGILRLDAEGRIKYANKRSEEILGLPLAAMTGRACDDPRWKLADSAGGPLAAEALPFNVIKQTGEAVFDVQYAIERPGGVKAVLSVNAAPLRNERDGFEGMVATVEDITDKYEAEQKYQMLFREMLDGFALHEIICDDRGQPIDYRFLDVNPAFERLTGLRAETVIGQKVLDVLPETESYWIETYGRVALTGKPAFFENYTKAIDRHFQVTAFRPAQNQFACIFVDVSERKRVEAERERLLLAIEQADEMVVIADAAGIIQYVNPAFERITGFTGKEALGRTPRILKSGRHDQTFYQELWETILSGSPWKGRLVNRRRNGGIYTAECSISPIKDDNGRVVNFVWISRDITNELELEKRVSQAQRMEAIGALAGGIAHDFNNLLFPILGLSEMLLEDLPPASPEGEQAGEIFKAAKRASSLVKQILAFSRQTEQDKTPIRIQTILKEIIRLARSTIPADIAIKSHIQLDCGAVMTNPTQMHQIAMNLMTNAYHAIEPNPGEIRVGLQEVTLENEPWPGSALAEGRYVLMSVADTGCGIAPADQGRIFEPYFTTKVQGKGTGLGLAVVYGIVKEHQGDIKVSSAPGEGTTFQVYLPLLDQPYEEQADRAVEPHPTGTERILVIDDEEAVVRLQRQMLESLGYRVSIRTDSREGLNVFHREADRFDLVITDMTMPGLTGDRLAAELLKIRPDVAIILCTGFSERITSEKAKAIGIKAFLMKPVAKSQLARAVRKVLDEARPPD